MVVVNEGRAEDERKRRRVARRKEEKKVESGSEMRGCERREEAFICF